MDFNKYKILIFDFDGTVANTVPHIINCILKVIDKFNLRKLSYDDIERFNGAVLGNVFKELGAKEEQLVEIKKYYAEIFMEDVSDIQLYDNVLDVLTMLKGRGLFLTIASNRGSDTMIPLLDHLSILSLFDRVVCSDNVTKKKPDPEVVDFILDEFKYQKEDALVFGDTGFDILMAKNAKCDSCYVCHGEKANEKVLDLKPDYVIYNFNDLINSKEI